jgi:Mce-associated membrane protein
MAEHADPSQKKLNESDQQETSPASSRSDDGDSLESPNGATWTKGNSEAVPAAEAAAEVQADETKNYNATAEAEADDSKDAAPAKKSMSAVRLATVLGMVMVVALAALVGWLGFRGYQSHQAQQQRELFVQVGRQGALNLTTIDWQHADADVQRILDSATGTFYDDFSRRSKPFVDVVKKAQSKSTGTVTEAGLESQSGNEAQVLVAVSVKTSNLGAAEQEPRHWRMRITLQKDRGGAKVSNVAFVP